MKTVDNIIGIITYSTVSYENRWWEVDPGFVTLVVHYDILSAT